MIYIYSIQQKLISYGEMLEIWCQGDGTKENSRTLKCIDYSRAGAKAWQDKFLNTGVRYFW